MKKITLALIAIIGFYSSNAQVLNQNANWPNNNWNLTGSYNNVGLLSNPTVSGSTFTFDDDAAGSSSNDALQLTSPIIDLTAANNAGETWITINGDYVYRALGGDILAIETYDADNDSWSALETFIGNAGGDDYQNCNNGEVYFTQELNIASFTPSQLSGFRYRITYFDQNGWQWGFCLTSPTISSQTPPACPNPTNLGASNITETSALLEWTEAGSSNSWNIEWGPGGFTIGTGTTVANLNSTTYSLTNLMSGTSYDFYVQANCNGGDQSNYIGPFNFSTVAPGGSCDSALSINVETNCSTATPTTLNFNNAPDVGLVPCDTFPTNYGYFLSFEAPGNGSVTINFSGAASNIGFIVYDGCNGNQISICDNNTLNAGDNSGIIGALTPGQTYYALIWKDFQSGTADICVEEGATCPAPSSLNANMLTLNSASLNWIENGTANTYNVEWGVAGFSQGTGNLVSNVNATNYNLSSLTEDTDYDFYVQSICTGETSNWAGPYAFSTLTPSRINFSLQPITVSGADLAVVDMNGDFLDDIVGVTSTNINIQQQNMDGSFTSFNITTPSANFLPSWSMAAADYDANGKTDLLYGAGSGVTFMKANADGTAFTEYSTTEYVFSQRSNFVDINNDGNLDAFVCHDVEPNVYFINDGTGNFTFYQSDVTPGAPFELGNFSSGGDYGSIWIDYNNDRNMDLFVSKCGGSVDRRTNIMYTNNGDGTYTENAAVIGLADPMQTWSSAWGDFDNDGDMDVFVGASSGTHKLMMNSGFSDDGNPNNDFLFTDVTAGAGITAPTGWESTVYDIDNDGNLDIISNGSIMYGKGDMTFEDADDNQINYKNGSFGDLNNDGFIDAYYNGVRYYNQGNSNNWVKINTVGMAHLTPNYSNRNGIGARVELVTPSGTQIRDVRSGEGFEFMSSLNTHFGIGTDTSITEIRIYWPSGIIDVLPNPAINTTHMVEEGTFQLSTDDAFLSNLNIYPNPVNDVLQINTPLDLTERIATIFDITGKRVFNQKLQTNQLNVSTLNSGVYVLRIESNGRSIRRKFIKN